MIGKLLNLDACRKELPALKSKTYFNFGGQGTMPQSSIDCITETFQRVQEIGPFSGAIFQWIGEELTQTRKELADLFGGSASSYAITQNTTEGCNIALWGLEWKSGDELITTDSEHGGVEDAMKNLCQRRGCVIKILPVIARADEDVLADLEKLISSKTRMIVVSHVVWNTGQTLPLAGIVELCKSRGVKVLVDGAQSAGVLPLNLETSGVDYYAITGHKWLGGPEGVGALYISPSALEETLETFVGWRKSMVPSEGTLGAARFEVATAPFPLLSALRNSMQFHTKWGDTAQRYAAIKSGAAYLRELLALQDVELLGGDTADAGLVSFVVKGRKHQAVARALEESKIFVRTIPTPDCIRASVHYFTTREDIEKLATALKNA